MLRGIVTGKGTYVGSSPVWIDVYPTTGPTATSGHLNPEAYLETLATDGTRLSYGGRMVLAGVHDLRVLDSRILTRYSGVPPKSQVKVLSTNGDIYVRPNHPFKLFDDDDFNDNDGSQKDGDVGENVELLSYTLSKLQVSDDPNNNPYAAAYIVPEYNWAAQQGLNNTNVTNVTLSIQPLLCSPLCRAETHNKHEPRFGGNGI